MAIEIAPKAKKATVTFMTKSGKDASQAALSGEWNNWEAMEMKKKSDGTFSIKVNIDMGKSYQFGYSIDGVWTTDSGLPLAASPFGTDNSILDLTNVAATKKSLAVARKTAPKKKSPACKRVAGKMPARKR
jgi:1,4-alpha-glucan branching enzyme